LDFSTNFYRFSKLADLNWGNTDIVVEKTLERKEDLQLGPSRFEPRRRRRSDGRSARRRRESGQEASTRRCGAGGELDEGQEGAERRDDGEAERQRWTGLPARCSGGMSARGWRRASQEALVECSGAGGHRIAGVGRRRWLTAASRTVAELWRW
jgi:hypothetical protein